MLVKNKVIASQLEEATLVAVRPESTIDELLWVGRTIGTYVGDIERALRAERLSGMDAFRRETAAQLPYNIDSLGEFYSTGLLALERAVSMAPGDGRSYGSLLTFLLESLDAMEKDPLLLKRAFWTAMRYGELGGDLGWWIGGFDDRTVTSLACRLFSHFKDEDARRSAAWVVTRAYSDHYLGKGPVLAEVKDGFAAPGKIESSARIRSRQGDLAMVLPPTVERRGVLWWRKLVYRREQAGVRQALVKHLTMLVEDGLRRCAGPEAKQLVALLAEPGPGALGPASVRVEFSPPGEVLSTNGLLSENGRTVVFETADAEGPLVFEAAIKVPAYPGRGWLLVPLLAFLGVGLVWYAKRVCKDLIHEYRQSTRRRCRDD